jgi:hypothetical protein
MIIEIATAAAMYLAENVTATAAESDIPQMRPRAAQPRDLTQQQTDPNAAMWDPNWISSVTPATEAEQKSGSATATNPKHGGSNGSVASKPHARSH